MKFQSALLLFHSLRTDPCSFWFLFKNIKKPKHEFMFRLLDVIYVPQKLTRSPNWNWRGSKAEVERLR
jgi:hypothetical protein